MLENMFSCKQPTDESVDEINLKEMMGLGHQPSAKTPFAGSKNEIQSPRVIDLGRNSSLCNIEPSKLTFITNENKILRQDQAQNQNPRRSLFDEIQVQDNDTEAKEYIGRNLQESFVSHISNMELSQISYLKNVETPQDQSLLMSDRTESKSVKKLIENQ